MVPVVVAVAAAVPVAVVKDITRGPGNSAATPAPVSASSGVPSLSW